MSFRIQGLGIIIVGWAFLLWSQVGFAKQTCEGVFYAQSIKNSGFAPAPTESDTEIHLLLSGEVGKPMGWVDRGTPEKFGRTIQAINEEVAASILKPKIVRIFLNQTADSPYSMPLKSIIVMGERFEKENKKLIHPKFSLAILAHEYGHILFWENLLVRYPNIQKVVEIESQMNDITVEIKKMAEVIRARKKEGEKKLELTAEEKNRIHELRAQFSSLVLARKPLAPEVVLILKRKTIYDEFWADVIAVLHTENPKAISKALHNVESNYKPEIVDAKEGAKANQVIEIMNEDAERRAFDDHLKKASQPHSGHSVLAEARRFIWERYLSQPFVMKHKARVAEKILKATLNQVEWITHLSLDQKQDAAFIKMLNDQLIESLDRELGQDFVGN